MVQQRCFGGLIQIPEQCFQKNEELLLNCNTQKMAVDALLPSIQSLGYRWIDIRLFDQDRNCSKNNITIRPSDGDRVNGSTEPIVLKDNGAGVLLMIFGQNDWKCIVLAGEKASKSKAIEEPKGEAEKVGQ